MVEYVVPFAHWEGVDYHWHGYASTARDHPPARPLAEYLDARPLATFGPDKKQQALDWLRHLLEEQPIPPSVSWPDPNGDKLRFAAGRLEQPQDVVCGYTSTNRAYAQRALILCPRPGVRCPGR